MRQRKRPLAVLCVAILARAQGRLLSNAPSTSETPADVFDKHSGFLCSVCEQDQILSKPEVRVPIPEGYAIPEASCSFVDKAVLHNPKQFTEDSCRELRDRYKDDCGCVYPGAPENPEVSAFSAESTTNEEDEPQLNPPPLYPPESCLICAPGQVMTKKNGLLVIPGGVIHQRQSYASCELMDTGLRANPHFVNENMCTTLKGWYSLVCGCRDLDDPWFLRPQTNFTSGSSSRRALTALVVGALSMATGLV